MKKLLLTCLLLLSFPVIHRATGQAVVRLLPGDVLDRSLIGVDTATWRRTLNYIDAAKVGLKAGRVHINNLTRELATASAAKNALQVELARCRDEGEASQKTITELGAQAQKLAALPIQPPLLADPRTYRVGGIALAVGFILGIFATH